jgi:signal transduction histidine kinase
MKKKSNLRTKIWMYLIIFSASILLFLWLFQIIFLKTYYREFRLNKLENSVKKVLNSFHDSNYEDLLDDISLEDEICIEVVNNNMTKYLSVIYNKGCMGAETSIENSYYKKDFINSNLSKKVYTLINPRFKNKTIIYGIKLDDSNYAFVSASLEPIDTTITVLKNQFIYVTMLVIILSLIVSYFVSRKISSGVIKINKEAKKLSKGNFDVKFDTDQPILELSELAETLEYTKDELSKTENLRRELLANVSHDLKTPLTMIKAYAEMVRDVTYKDDTKRTKDLNIIIEETDRLNVLVNDILELSKIQSGTQKLTIEQFDLEKFVKNIIKRYDIMSENKKYKFKVSINKNIIVSADRKRIEQVMYNLINNAINYTGDDKKIIISALELENTVRIEVKDTGKGIDKEELENIWDKYYKIDKTHSREQVGSGVGLSIVKNILINHNCNYGVESIKGNGTIFYFELPKVK